MNSRCFAIAILAVTACGKSDSSSATNGAASSTTGAPASPPAGAAKTACEVLSLDIAQTVVGKDATKSIDKQPNKHVTHCQYRGSGGVADVMVGGWSYIKGPFKTTPVAGIGDEAGESNMGLVVRKGDRGMSISMMLEAGTFTGSEATRVEGAAAAAARDLAKKLVDRL